MAVSINKELCKGCKICVNFCPVKILTLSGKLNHHGYEYVTVADQEKCISCEKCEKFCPDFAIHVIRKKTAKGEQEGKKG